MISPAAKDFISLLLVRDPRKRPSASSCLSHPWLREGGEGRNVTIHNKTNLRKFLARRRWQRCGQAIR